MRTTSKRHLRQDVLDGNVKLPRSLSYLRDGDFDAVVNRITDGESAWWVELKPATLKKLFVHRTQRYSAESREEALRAELDEKHKALTRSEAELRQALEQCRVLQHNLDTLLPRLEARGDDPRPQRTHGKTFFERAEEGTLRPHQQAMNGGLPGLGKRR
jgi:hypothetical protein